MKIDSKLNLPFTEWRPGQLEAVNDIVASGKSFLLDAPTGVGKSLLAIAVHKLVGGKCVYICQTKQLQEQIVKDFNDAVILKGRKNYACLKREELYPRVTADDCLFENPGDCGQYSHCEYYRRKKAAKEAPLVVLNSAYFITESNLASRAFIGRELIIADEIDSIESTLREFIELTLTVEQLDRNGLTHPSDLTARQSWIDWMPSCSTQLADCIEATQSRIRSTDESSSLHQELRREKRRLESLQWKVSFIIANVTPTWLFYYKDRKCTFKPLIIGELGNRFLWSYGSRILGMSGTILNPSMLASEIGFPSYDYMRLDSGFPLKNRPIYYHPVVNMKYALMDRELPHLVSEIDSLIDRYPNGKVLVHTVSYSIRNYLVANLKTTRRVITHDSVDRESALDDFKHTSDPVVFLSPSMDRGVDLPTKDNCQCVIICKVPYMSTGDELTGARMKLSDGPQWYATKAVQTLVQSTGRAVRSSTQTCDTWILDEQFLRLRNMMRQTFPKWWLDAVQPAVIPTVKYK
jgi:ATP-dependent DNA helicase DinG